GTTHGDTHVLGQLGAGDNLIHLVGKTPEIFTARRNIYVDDAAELVVVHLRRGIDHLHIRHGIEVGGVQVARSMQGYLLEVCYGVDLGFRILHREHVVVPILRIDPVAGSDYAIRGQGSDNVVHCFLGGHPHTSSHFAVDIELNTRIIEVLRNEHVARATEPTHLLSDLGR